MNLDQRLLGRVWNVLRARDAWRPPTAAADRRGLSIVDYDQGSSELLIYAEIGYWGITAQEVADLLQGRQGDLHVRINSPGGDVFDGYAIYNMLAAHNGRITVTVEGLAASAASFIAMAGDEIRMCLASQMMIHDASGLCIGNAAEMREWANVLDSISVVIASVYAERGGGEPDMWREQMLREAWYTPQEAVDAGLADEVITPNRRSNDGQTDPMAAAKWDLTVFMYAGREHAPEPEPVIPAQRDAADQTATDTTAEPDDTTDTTKDADETNRAPEPSAADTGAATDEHHNWAALVSGLLTAPAPATAPSTVDELLGNLHKEGWTAR